MLRREQWLEFARKLDWEFSYVSERDVYPAEQSGDPWLPSSAWADWEEPFRTTYAEYVSGQHEMDIALYAVRDARASPVP